MKIIGIPWGILYTIEAIKGAWAVAEQMLAVVSQPHPSPATA